MIEKKKVLALFVVLIVTALLLIGSLICCLNLNSFVPKVDEDSEDYENENVLRGISLLLGGILLIPLIVIYMGLAALLLVYALLIMCAKAPDTLATHCKVLIIVLAIAMLGFLGGQIVFIAIMSAADLPLALGILSLVGYVAAFVLSITTRKYANSVEDDPAIY